MTEEEARRFYHGSRWTPEEIRILQRRGQPMVGVEGRDWLFWMPEIEEIVLNHD